MTQSIFCFYIIITYNPNAIKLLLQMDEFVLQTKVNVCQ